MNRICREVYVTRNTIKDPIAYVQGTNAIPLEFIFRDWTIPEGATAKVFVRKPSGKGVYDVATIIDNKVLVKVTNQMFLETGTSELQIQIVKEENTLVTCVFQVCVGRNIVAGDLPKSENSSNFIEEALRNISEKAEEVEKAIITTNQATENANTKAKEAFQAASKADTAAENANKKAQEAHTVSSEALAATEYANRAAFNADGSAVVAAKASKEANAAADEARIAITEITEGLESASETAKQEVSAAGEIERLGVIQQSNLEKAKIQNYTKTIISTIPEDYTKLDSHVRDLERVSALGIAEDVSGKILHLEDSDDKPVQALTLYGHSEQIQTTGAQLFDYSVDNVSKVRCTVTEKYGDITFIPTGYDAYFGEITVQGNPYVSKAGNIIKVSNGKYYYNITNSKINRVFVTKFDKDKISLGYAQAYGQKGMITIESGVEYVVFRLGTDTNDIGNAIKFKIMINSGEVSLPWEAYTGGQPSPRPGVSQTINSVGDKNIINEYVSSSNLFDVNKLQSKTIFGVTFTILGDGGIKVSGTATGYASVSYVSPLTNGTYFISSNAKYKSLVRVRNYISQTSFVEYSNASFEKDDSWTDYNFRIQVDTGVTINEIVYPMLNIGANTLPWVPYKPVQTLTIDAPGGLNGIKVDSGGNYTDETGQQWICDTVEFYEDGTGKHIQRIGTVNNDNWVLSEIEPGMNGHRFAVVTGIKKVSHVNVICSNYIQKKVTSYNTVGDYISSSESLGSFLHIRTLEKDFKTAQEFITWTKETNMKTYYILEIPNITALTEQQLTVFKSLKSYKQQTDIWNDESADQSVKYIADTKTYIDNKVGQAITKQMQKFATTMALLPDSVQAAMINNDTQQLLESEDMYYE